MAASDEAELVRMVSTSVAYDNGPIAFRYPRGEGIGIEIPEVGEILEIGKGRIVKEGKKLAILSFGTILKDVLLASDVLSDYGMNVTIADARFAKPLDVNLIKNLAENHEYILTIEEGSIGGFGSHVINYLSENGFLDQNLKIRSMHFPDIFIDQATPSEMYEKAGMNSEKIVKKILNFVNNKLSRAKRNSNAKFKLVK